MPRLSPATDEGTWIYKIFAHCSEIQRKWDGLDASLRDDGVLDDELKEQVRRALASDIGCEFCKTVGGPPAERPDERTSIAIGYAQLLRVAPGELDDASFDVLREHFTEREIVELTCWILFKSAYQSFGAVMRVPAATEDEAAQYRAFLDSGEPVAWGAEAR